MAEPEVDKMSKIYSVLTDEEIEAWVSSEGEPKLPSEGVTAAFREAEGLFAEEQDGGDRGDGVEINYRDIDIPRLSEVLSELVWRIVGGTLPVGVAVDYLASEKPFRKRLGVHEGQGEGSGDKEEGGEEESGDGKEGGGGGKDKGKGDGGTTVEPLVEALCDAVWGVDVMVRGTVDADCLEKLTVPQRRQWNRLCSFVQRLHADKLVPERAILVLSSEEVLEGSGIIAPPTTTVRGKTATPLSRAILKKNTDVMYKQTRFNLQREETEGFAKLLVLVGGLRDGGKAMESQSEDNMRRLIGYFDLDPNRSLDLTLDALESDPSNRGLLRLVENFSKGSVPHVVGFKLAHYRNPSVAKYHRASVRAALKNKEIDPETCKIQLEKVTPRSLYVLIAVLLTTGNLSMEDMLKHVSPGIISLAAKEKEYMADLEDKVAKAGSKVLNLDADGNVCVSKTSTTSDNALSKLGSMSSLPMGGGGYGGGMMGGAMGGGSGTLYGGRDRDRNAAMGNGHGRDRDGRRDSRDRDRDGGRRQGPDTSAAGGSVKASANGGTAAAVTGGGENDDDPSPPGTDNQLYGVLEALLDIRAWALASDLLGRLTKQGIDPLRDYGVREALKRLVKDSVDGLASRYPKPITLYPPGAKKGPATPAASPAGGVASGPSSPSSPTSMSGMASDMEEAEAGEVTLSALSRPASSRPFGGGSFPTATVRKTSADLKDLHRVPGYGTGFVKTDVLSGAVAVLAPLLKILGPHLGRDPTMLARVCRVLAAVNSRNPLNMVAKTSASRRSGSSSNSASMATKLAAANAAAGANSAASPAASAPSSAATAAGATSNGSVVAAAATFTPASHNKEASAARDPHRDPLKAFHSLLGLSIAEARELYSRGEAEAGAGGGEGALKKELARRKGAYIRVVLTVAPSLGMTHANPGMQREVWSMLAELPYEDRFMLYGAWRGHGMEKHALGVKHVQYAVAEIAAGSEISRLIKMLTSDNVKDMARKLGKSSHSHPLLFAEKVLNQLESYDNFISMVADSMKFVGNTLGLDCVAYTMVQHLCQSNRSFVSDSGLTLEKWVTNLSMFAGQLHRKHCETDCKPLLSWAVRSLGEGGEPALAAGKVLREVLHKAGGVQVLDGWSITQAQVDGKGGGDVLRQENASFGSTIRPIRKARSVLQDGTEKAGASLPLLILPAHQSESLLYEGGSLDDQMRGKPQPHLKVLAHQADETHTTMLQAIEFVCSKSWIRTKCPSINALLTTYGLEPRVVFHIWRPVINENLIKFWFPKTGTKTDKEQREEAYAKRFIGELEVTISKLSIVPGSSPLTAKLILIFWALSLPDVYIPTKKYAQVVTNMNEAKRRAESKLLQAEEKEITLSKAERARYLAERKTGPVLATKLDAEKASQAAHVKRVKNKLREIKAALFSEKHRTGTDTIDAVLKHLVAPRMGMGPEEAYFCSKFFNTLHAIEAPNFNSLLFYSRSFEGLSTTLLCKTQYEAAGLGFFLKDLLENIKEWRKPGNEAIFKMEAGTKHGFNIGQDVVAKTDGKGKAVQVKHADFVNTSGDWSMQVTKALLAAVASDEFLLIKCGLIMYNKLLETFPVSLREREMLHAKLKPKTDRGIEPRDDIRVPCTRIVTQLEKQIKDSAPDPAPVSNQAADASGTAKGHADGRNGKGTGKLAPISTASAGRTVGGLNSRSRGSKADAASPSDGKASALSAAAKPYVPGSGSAGGPSSSNSSSSKSNNGGHATVKQEVDAGAVKKEPALAAVKQELAPTTVKKEQGSASSAGAAKRAREGVEATRPAKTARVAEQGEVVSGKGGTDYASEAAESKHAAGAGRDRHPRPLQKTPSSSSVASEGASKSAASRSSAATAAAAGSGSSRNLSRTSSSANARTSGREASTSGRVDSSKQQQQHQQHQQHQQQSRSGGGGGGAAAGDQASVSGSGGSARSGRAARASSGGGGGNGSINGVTGDGGLPEQGRSRRETSARIGDADSRAKAVASQDMERPAARDSGSGSLAVRRGRDARDAHGTVARTNNNSRMGAARGTIGDQQQDRSGARDAGRRESREDVRSSSGGSGSGGGGGGYAGEAVRGGRLDEGGRGTAGSARGEAASGRFEGPARAGGGQRMVESSRGGGSGGGGTPRGNKRGRSADPDRGGGRDVGFDGGGGSAEGDPSQAFDSKRMRQPEQAMLHSEGGMGGSSRPSVDGWGRGYSGGGRGGVGGGGGGRGSAREREGPAAPADVGNGRYRDDANLRHGAGGGGGGGRMQMPSREVHMDRPAYEGRGGGRGGRSGAAMDGGGEGQDRGGGGGGGGGHRDVRGGRENPSDDDVRSRSSRSSREGKKSRGDKHRGGSNRDGDGDGGGGRKEKKKSSKSKKKKH